MKRLFSKWFPVICAILGWFAPELSGAPDPSLRQHVLRNWTTVDGLPDNTVRFITGSRSGHLWIGTASGVARFDGVRFVTPACTNSIVPTTESVWRLYEDRRGALWISGRRGIGILENEHYRTLDPEPTRPRYAFAKVIEDRKGQTWVAAGRLHRWSGDRLEPYRSERQPELGDILDMCAGSEGEIWISTYNGLWRESADGFTRVDDTRRVGILQPNGPDSIWSLNDSGDLQKWAGGKWSSEPGFGELPRTILRRRNGDLWVGAYDSARIWRIRDGSRLLVSRADGFEGNSVICFHEDNEGSIWVGVNGRGLYQIREQRLDVYDEQHGFQLPFLASVAEGADGTIHASVMRAGEYRFAGNRFERIEVDAPGFGFGLPTALVPARSGGFWMGTFYGQLPRIVDRRLVEKIGADAGTRVLLTGHDGSLWRGTRLAGLEHHSPTGLVTYTAPAQLPANDILCLAEEPSGAIWVGTESGLCRLFQGSVKRFGTADGLGSDYVRALSVDSTGTVWAGTLDGGLSAFDGTRFTTLTTREGLPDNRILQIQEDDYRQLWLGTRSGLMRVSIDDLHRVVQGSRRYLHGTLVGPEEGLRWPDTGSEYHPSTCKARDGRLWFCTGAGLVVIDPRRFSTSAPPPVVHIEEFSVDGVVTTIPTGSKRVLRVDPLPERIEIRFTGLSYSAPTKVRFRYQLDGYDSEVIEGGRRRTATYTQIRPGHYRFHVTAGNNDGIWSPEGATIEFDVLPAFWQTWTFRGTMSLGLALAVFAAFRIRVRRVLRRQRAQAEFARQVIDSQEAERKRIAIELHDGLGQNLLLAVNRAALATRESLTPDTAKSRLRDVEALLRDAIQEVRTVSQNLRPAHLEKIGLTKSIEAMVRQVGESAAIQFHCRIDPVDLVVPRDATIQIFRIIQEALNNVIKHSMATEAWVTIEASSENVVFEIRDNGRGFDAAARLLARGPAGLGLGLGGMSERVRLLGGRWDCTSSPGQGTTIRITLGKRVAEIPPG